MNSYNKEDTDWEGVLEWEPVDSSDDMIVRDPCMKEHQKLKEERKKVEEADHTLTEELFQNEDEQNTSKPKSIKEKGAVVLNKMKSSGVKLVDEVIKKTKNIKFDKPKISSKNSSKVSKNKRKIHDEYTLNILEDKAFGIEDKYLFNRR